MVSIEVIITINVDTQIERVADSEFKFFGTYS